MTKRRGGFRLPFYLLACALAPAQAQDAGPDVSSQDAAAELRELRLDRLEHLQDQKLRSGEIDQAQYQVFDELLEELRNARPGIDFPVFDDPVRVNIPVTPRSPRHTEMPVPGASGASGLPGVLGDILDTASEDWLKCRASGKLVYDGACGLSTGACPDLASGYRDHCFTLVAPGAPMTLPSANALETVAFDRLERSLVVLHVAGTPTCTGVFLDPQHVLTAAHCRRWIEDCQASGPVCQPLFHRIGSRSGTRLRLARLLTQEFSGDVAALDFDIWRTDTPTDDVQTLPILPLAATRPTGVDVPATIIGVTTLGCPPQRGSEAAPCQPRGALWQPAPFTNCRITCKTPNGALLHECQTAPGHSGAPILHWQDNGLRLAGIHVEFNTGPRPAACPGESQVGVSMTGICRWINDNAPELKGSCLEN